MLAFITWDVDPLAFSLFGRPIVWYGILWATGVLLTGFVVQKLYAKDKLPEKWFDSLFMYVVIGLIIGARLGHCLFYDPVYYLTHPFDLIKVWEGGLSSHGGAIGMLLAVWFYSIRITKKSIVWALDRLIIGVCVGATLIRIGNLMNSEIYGGVTDLPWGFRFIRDTMWHYPIEMGGSGALPVHPTQIYEALAYFTLFFIGMYMFYKTNAKEKQGLILGVSLTWIFGFRFFVEMIKNDQGEFDQAVISTLGINLGQLLSVPFIIWGIYLIWNACKKGNNQKEKSKIKC